MKIILSTIVVGIVLFLLGWVLWGIIFMDFFKTHYGHFSRGEDMKIWAYIVGCLTQAFFLALLYPKGYKGGSPAAEGFKFGIYIGLFIAVPYVFFMWGGYTVTYTAAIVDGILSFVTLLIAGLLTGIIFGKKEEKAAA